MELIIQPRGCDWNALISQQPSGTLLGKPQSQWRRQTREELGLETVRRIVATGHQTLLWHPGILAKYFATDAFASGHDCATANLVVDQHVGNFGELDIPVRSPDGSLGVRRLNLCTPLPRTEVPMGRHEAFIPPQPPAETDLHAAIPAVAEGVQRIYKAVHAHHNAPNAALQMAEAIADLMGSRVLPMRNVTATDLIRTSLAIAIMREMVRDPHRCAQCYNRAVQQVPEAGIGPLMIRDDYVEMPLWRVGDDGRRMRAYDNDVERFKIQDPKSKIDLLPRALFMTALVRLGMCDLFVHGKGGANYDRAMELWMRDWLGVEVGSIAIVSADLHLPLIEGHEAAIDVAQAIREVRRRWHDPFTSQSPSQRKQGMVHSIATLPRKSPQRKAAYVSMHEALEAARAQHASSINDAQQHVQRAIRMAHDRSIATRRDWAFPLYPDAMLDQLAEEARRKFQS